jgi:hypothetical protein
MSQFCPSVPLVSTAADGCLDLKRHYNMMLVKFTLGQMRLALLVRVLAFL